MSRKAEIFKELYDLQVMIDKSEKFRIQGNPSMEIFFEASDKSISIIHRFENDPSFVKAMQDDLIHKFKINHDALMNELKAIELENNPLFSKFL